MDSAGHLFSHAPTQAVCRSPGQLLEIVDSAPAPSVRQLYDLLPAEETADLATETELAGLVDLRGALDMVACGKARSITLCAFPDDHRLLRVGRELAIEGVAIEPLIRTGGGGFDIRVRYASPAEA